MPVCEFKDIAVRQYFEFLTVKHSICQKISEDAYQKVSEQGQDYGHGPPTHYSEPNIQVLKSKGRYGPVIETDGRYP